MFPMCPVPRHAETKKSVADRQMDRHFDSWISVYRSDAYGFLFNNNNPGYHNIYFVFLHYKLILQKLQYFNIFRLQYDKKMTCSSTSAINNSNSNFMPYLSVTDLTRTIYRQKFWKKNIQRHEHIAQTRNLTFTAVTHVHLDVNFLKGQGQVWWYGFKGWKNLKVITCPAQRKDGKTEKKMHLRNFFLNLYLCCEIN